MLSTQSETLDDVAVSFHVFFLEVVKEPSSLPDKFQQSPARMMILFVNLEVLSQIPDAGADQCDLNFRRPRILLMLFEIAYNFFFSLFIQHSLQSSLNALNN